ncbi:2,3-bisphosphoglycerate-independent phosphoglycerate mutase [Ureaplasma urealyticum]|uniref:2,3-bisphosphoglycerate-independent phosphoglycerate mutase n=1 Tax=Ureaplasma urealyticum TaxID=2130 RepID=UPI001F605A7C|nr:2,3-bisphosphoglycerate-independent phosphoglycerate mutase [Ureaplasma urealyticum]UNT66378.1 2,3-bisphosphoglycerate-independent phosphoglycerate mutase [Ureaplasma urealyticum]
MSLNKKLALIIIDGLGIGKKDDTNAVYLANPKTLNYLIKNYPTLEISAAQQPIGLLENQAGNSEIGHLTIGAGRIILNDNANINSYTKRLNYESLVLNDINNEIVHIVGMYSNGLVHSNYEHIHWIIKELVKNNNQVVLHLISDGRDDYPYGFAQFIEQINALKTQYNVIIKSLSGRYFAMDRDQRWERTQKAFNTMFIKQDKICEQSLLEVAQSIANHYESDEFVEPIVFNNDEKYNLKPYQKVILTNYRSDRMRQLAHLLKPNRKFNYHNPFLIKDIHLITLVPFPDVDAITLFEKQNLNNTLGDVLNDHHIKQARVAETEKYGHISFFFDGGINKHYASKTQYLIPSQKVATYDLCPQMSASLITKTIIDHYFDHDVFIVNYANPDMVGHSGNMKRTIQAILSVDSEIQKLYDFFKKNNGVLMITGDHGNAETMIDANGQIITSHSINDVWFIITDNNIVFDQTQKFSLANIAPTILEYLNIKKPIEIAASSMIKKIHK